jgi:hypothetical protein
VVEPATNPEPKPQSLPALRPVRVKPGILFNRTGKEELAPLAILTAPGRDYFVKLIDADTEETAVGIYVEGGKPADVTVPLGSYEMRYASGSTWYGFADLFGPGTNYSRVGETLNFREENNQYRGYTIELTLQAGGNLDTVDISAQEF